MPAEHPEAIRRLIRAWERHAELPFPAGPGHDDEAYAFSLLVLEDGYLAGHAYSVLGLDVAEGNPRKEAANRRRIEALLAGDATLRRPAVATSEIQWYSDLDEAWSSPAGSLDGEETLLAVREYRDVLRELAEALSQALAVSLVHDPREGEARS